MATLPPASEEVQTTVHDLELKRGSRRGIATKLHNRIVKVIAEGPDKINTCTLEDLFAQLTAAIDKHTAFQAQLEEFYDAFTDLRTPAKEAEDTDLLDTHVEWKSVVSNVLKALPLRRQAVSLLADIESALDSPMPDSPFFRNSVDKLHSRRVSVIDLSTEFYFAMPELKAICDQIIDKMNRLFTLTAAACKEAPTLAVPAAVATPVPSAVPDRNALNIELPTYDGDPFKWANFCTMFKRTIDKRAKGHSPLEVKGLLIKAVKHPDGLKVLHNLPSDDLSLDVMLDKLESIFGAPDVLAPIIIARIKSVSSCSLSASDVDNLYDNFILPYNKFCSLVGDSLGSFLALTASNFMSPECRREWLRHRPTGVPPDMKNLSAFIDFQKKELRGSGSPTIVPPSSSYLPLSSVRPASPRLDRSRSLPAKPPPRRPSQHCPVCGDSHSLARCQSFAAYDLDKRNKIVREKKLCLNCLGDGHGCKTCPSKFSCRTCNGRHHTMLHRDRDVSSTSQPVSVSGMTNQADSNHRDIASLYSAIVAFNCDGQTVLARALLDTGASLSMMTESLATSLQLPRNHDPIPVSGIVGTTRCKHTVKSDVCSVDYRFKLPNVTFIVIPSLKPLNKPNKVTEILKMPELRHFSLADSDLGGKVDLLLGVKPSSTLTTGTPFQVGELMAWPTQLGLCLSCPLDVAASPVANTVSSVPDLDADLTKLWELDRVPEASCLTQEEQSALDQFDNSCQRIDRRYSVSLPRTTSPPELGDSRRQALSRLYANERTLDTKKKLLPFQDVVREYFTLDHAEDVPSDELTKSAYYLPVHAVIKDSSTSTKVRAVFDASARTSTGSSLNDQLLAGPNLYPPLSDVLIRFRCHTSAVSADISKMFREILLNAEERDWHRFLYRNTDNTIREARMKRLTFGVKSSPFIATQVLRHHATTHLESHPTAANIILTDFYVDDVLTGAPTTDQAFQLFNDLRSLLSDACMDLRKWRTNDPALRKLIPAHLLESDTCSISPDSSAPKALGVHWDTTADSLHVSIPDTSSVPAKVTKRVIAAITAGVFDVLGLFSPVVICARILFQDTWRRNISWDEEVPEDLLDRWKDWIADLPIIHSHPVPRRLFINSSPTRKLTLHGFCDASSVAYGAVIYARTKAPDATAHTSLVVAKARVLPTKPLTIPKAELAGALLLAKMMSHTLDLLQLPTSASYAWTDSQIVLFWLPKAPSALNRFVANRVASIQELLPPTHWRHVPSAQNPADLASRGVRAEELLASKLWWHGPNWLSQPPQNWPPPFRSQPTISVYTVSVKPCLTLPPSQRAFICYLASICSSFFSLVRVLCYVYRFFNNCRAAAKDRTSGALTLTDIDHAKSTLYKLSQLETFPEALRAAEKLSPFPRGHPLHHFHVKLSNAGHLVALSRVRNPDSPNSPGELVVLSVKSELTKLLLISLHRSYGHPGTSTLTAIISNSFVIVGMRNYLKKVSRLCVTCQKVLAQPLSHLMGLLPSVRTTPAPPFYNTGVDFAGPLTLRVGYTRKPVHIKCYVAVFVCMSTKAVHLDLCERLTTDDFMATLRRFVARRGCPAHVYSDNGSNFVGAAEEIRVIKKLTESEDFKHNLISFCSTNDITWHHIPPRAPHFGGLWEAAVKAMKVGLKKIAAPHPLTWPELYTLLTEVESILNSRPITPLQASDLEEANVLTPGHFLIGRPLKAPPTKLPPSGKLSLIRRWNLVERLQSDLWKYWSAAYLSSCVSRAKWLRPGYSLQVEDVVLVKDESLKSRSWPLALVTELHPGDDGVSRVATLRCRGKIYTRAVNRLVPLVTDANENSASSDLPAASSAPPGVCSGLRTDQEST